MRTIDLSERTGLPLGLDEDDLLILGNDLIVADSKVRPFDALTPVALDPESCDGNKGVAYYMENDAFLSADQEMIQKLPVQYELTLMPPAMMGREYVKTFGHRHIAEPRSGIDYTEVCRVEYGTAHFLLHDLDLDRDAPSSGVAYLIEAKAGDTILLPPGYDHLTINPGPGPMLFSDVIARGVYGIYDRFRVTRGACLLEVESGGSPTFIPNPTYSNVPSLQRIPMCEYPKLQLGRDIPLYQALCETKGDIWEFLLDPTLFWPCFPDLKAAMGIQ